MLNIALAGPICSGKTTIAQAFVDVLGYRRLAFADELKREVARGHGITVDELNADKSRYREELRFHGAVARKVDPLHWCKRVGERIAARSWTSRPLILDDLRYHNEAEYLRERGFVIVAVHTPDPIRRRRHYDRYHADLPDDDESERQSKTVAADFYVNGMPRPAMAVAEIISWYARQADGND